MEKKLKRVIGYRDHVKPIKRCGNCAHSFCHNPGANVPGLSCKIVEAIGKLIDDVRVVDEEALCKLYVKKSSK